jgi:DNA replication protein DnaC
MLRKAVETQSKIINLDQEYQDARFANWIVREDWQQGILDSAKKFVDSLRDQRGYFIAGGAGTGKTRIVCTIINELQRRLGVDYKMIFLKYSTLLIEARKKGDPMKYMSYDLVCIDDLTKEGVGMEFAQYVYPLIESRYANKKQLLITSNMALETWLGHSDNYVRRLGDRFRNFMRRATFGKESMRGGKI